MATLFQCKTGYGPLVVTDEGIYVKEPQFGSITGSATRYVLKADLAGGDVAVLMPPILGRGGFMNFTLRLRDGSKILIRSVPWKEAKLLKSYLGIPDI